MGWFVGDSFYFATGWVRLG